MINGKKQARRWAKVSVLGDRLGGVLRVGLTGGIGAGKSTVAQRLVKLSAHLIDADVVAREVVEPGTSGFDAVVEEFGPDVVAADGSLDRAALGRIVFQDPQRRGALNAIVHPRVYQRRTELVAAAPRDAVVVEDIPLLVENRLGAAYHLVVVVHAPAEERVRRLTDGRGMDAGEAWSRVRAQADDEMRRTAADVWLDNGGTRGTVLGDVDELWRERLVPFERNVRSRTAVRRSSAPTLVPYDESWPSQAYRLIARVAYAAGDRAIRVDHVGSTSIPGISAKDVIDLQLSVRSLDDADGIRGDLEKAGFPHVPGYSDTPKAVAPDPALWQKRLHGSADPGRVVHLHVREAGSMGWRYALLFRDWLRADSGEMREYESEKLRLAAAYPTTAEYANAKDPWFDHALERADKWAAQTAWVP